MSEIWNSYGGGDGGKYFVLEQRTASGKYTGYIKVVPKSKASTSWYYGIVVEAKKSDCLYYKRRTGK